MSLVDNNAANHREKPALTQTSILGRSTRQQQNPRTCNAMKDKDDTHPCIDAATRGARQVHDVRKRHKNANQQKCCNGVYTRNDAVAEAFNGVN
jgi:hypothetical protein